MKKIMTVAMALIVACGFTFADNVSDQKQIYKERAEIRKMTEKQLKAKVDKLTKAEAKKKEKEGWQVKPGALPLIKQLDQSFHMQLEFTEDHFPKYIFGESSAIGENYDAAKTAAKVAAINDLAGNIETEIETSLEASVGNKELSQGDAASIAKTAKGSVQRIAQAIGRTITVTECYRMNAKHNYEVELRIAYPAQSVKETAKQVMRDELEKEGNNLLEKLDKALGN